MNNIYKVKTQNVPDDYEIEIHFITGNVEKINVVTHSLLNQNATSILSIQTKEDLIRWVLLDNIKEIKFDLNFSKILEAKSEKEKETRTKMLEEIPEALKDAALKDLEGERLNERLSLYKNHLRSIA